MEITNLRQPDVGISEWLTIAEPVESDWTTVLKGESYTTKAVCVAGWKTVFGFIGCKKASYATTAARGLFALFTSGEFFYPNAMGEVYYPNPVFDEASYYRAPILPGQWDIYVQRDVKVVPVNENAIFRFEIPITFNFCFCKFYNCHPVSEGTSAYIDFYFGIYARGR